MRNTLLSALLLALLSGTAGAEETKLDMSSLPDDLAARLRGMDTVVTNCNGCHSLKYIKYRDLVKLGAAPAKVDGWRGDKPLDAPLSAQLSENDARESFGGVVPPDLSLMAAAREGGAHYLYSYLTGYRTDAKGGTVNTVFPETRMPDVLGIAAETDMQKRAEIAEHTKEVTAFLTWAADPHADERRRLGKYVIGYLAVLTMLLYVWKRRIWRRIDSQPPIE
ncbi:MAG: cytochrome c1 [Pseudomonadota bacterium]